MHVSREPSEWLFLAGGLADPKTFGHRGGAVLFCDIVV